MRIFAFGFVTFLVTHITAQVHGVPKTPLPPKSTTMLVPMSESETKTTPTVETKATLNVDPKASLETSTQAEPKTEHKPQLKSVFTHRSELALTLNLDRKRELRKPTPYQPLFHSISTVEQQCRKACIDGFDFCLKVRLFSSPPLWTTASPNWPQFRS